jgi:hypothetical protein
MIRRRRLRRLPRSEIALHISTHSLAGSMMIQRPLSLPRRWRTSLVQSPRLPPQSITTGSLILRDSNTLAAVVFSPLSQPVPHPLPTRMFKYDAIISTPLVAPTPFTIRPSIGVTFFADFQVFSRVRTNDFWPHYQPISGESPCGFQFKAPVCSKARGLGRSGFGYPIRA